jgi:hypothetical protein
MQEQDLAAAKEEENKKPEYASPEIKDLGAIINFTGSL